jgi:hypothetical protein
MRDSLTARVEIECIATTGTHGPRPGLLPRKHLRCASGTYPLWASHAEVVMPDRELWKSRILTAGREAKRFAVAAARQADALIQVARQKAETAARRRKMQRTLQQASRVLKTAGKAALAAGAVAAIGAVAREINGRSQKKRRVPA